MTPMQINAVVIKTLAFKPNAILLILKPPLKKISFCNGEIYGGKKEIQGNSTSNKTSLFYCFIEETEIKALK